MSIPRDDISIGRAGGKIALREGDTGEVWERFHDVKSHLRARYGSDIEVTNRVVMNYLLDIEAYWSESE